LTSSLPTCQRAVAVKSYPRSPIKIAGVLPWEPMVEIVESLCESADLKPGDRVKTLRGTARGVIVRRLDDGRLVWQVDGSGAELMSLPESLIPERAQ
jgi:hypothetical protein